MRDRDMAAPTKPHKGAGMEGFIASWYARQTARDLDEFQRIARRIAAYLNSGDRVLEIAPAESPLLLFVWSAQRVLPVRITECSITEEAFDPTLNPFRVKVSMSLRVLNVDDLPSSHRGTTLFLSYLQRKEYLATKAPAASLESLGIGAI